MISTEQLSKAVFDKMYAEQQAFRKELLQMKPEDILDQAYVYAVREDILCAMENTELSMRQALALLVTDTPLAYVYKTYLGKDPDYMEHINESLEDFASDMAKVHAETRDLPVYRHTFDYAVAHGEEKQYRDSFHANVACKGAIEKAISQHYAHNCMDALASQQVVHEFGFDRTMYVLANTIQLKDWDGRFSLDNKAWASTIQIAGGDEGVRDHRWKFVVDKSHPGLTDMFTAMVRHDQAESEKQRASIRALLRAHSSTTAKAVKGSKQHEEVR
jgi:hypothetical protein